MFFYVYQIVNKLNNKRYIGSRTSNIPPEEDLGYRYRSSSRNKEFIEDMNKNPTCYDFCRIIKIYDNFNNLRFTIGRNISCTKFCSENDIFCAKSLYHLLKTHTKLTKGKWVGWYAVEEKLND